MANGACYVVLGATGGIGAALSRRLAGAGARLVVAARNADRLVELADTLGALPFPLDATNLDQVDACLPEANRLHGQVDGVANCVGSLCSSPLT